MKPGRWLAGRGPWPARRPRYVSIDVCDRCNLRCVACSAWRPRPGSALIERAVFTRLLANLSGLQGSGVDLIGAEPTLHPALPALVAETAAAGFAPRLFSNGTRLDAALARALVAAGLRGVTISVDGARPETHDRLRGVSGAHALALQAIARLAEAGRGRGLEVSSFTVVSRENFEELPEIVRLSHERGAGRSAFHFVSQVPETACHAAGVSAQYAAGEARLLLGAADLDAFRSSVARALEIGGSPSLALLRALGRETLLDGRFPVTACRFVRVGLNVATDGQIYPCSHFSHVRWGSLAERHWQALWRDAERQAFLRRLDRGLFDVCSYCCHHVHNLTLPQLGRVALRLPLGRR